MRSLQTIVTILILVIWSALMTWFGGWGLFQAFWVASAAMLFSSFLGSATPIGGGAVAFPIFTKLLQVSAADSRTFALMIQSVGMGMASLLIVTRHIKFLPRVVGWGSIGGAIGMIAGSLWVQLPAPMPKLLFTCIATAFLGALAYLYVDPDTEPKIDIEPFSAGTALFFGLVGLAGGILSANIGSGINLLSFIVLLVGFRVSPKVALPTSVILMAINSWVGFGTHLVLQDIGIAWSYWAVSVPFVIIGAPLGSFMASRVRPNVIFAVLSTLITVELISTLLMVPLTVAQWGMAAGFLMVSFLGLWGLIRLRALRASDDARRIDKADVSAEISGLAGDRPAH